MARFYPETFLEKVMPGGIAKNGLLYDNLSIKKRYLRALYKVAGREGKALKETVLETIAYYAKREEKLGTQALLTQRIENFLVWNKVQEEKEAHAGQYYRWLPSDAQNPDPEHQLNYGKIFRVGDGHEMPGERYGCRCGIEWLDSGEAKAEKLLSNSNPVFVQKAQRMFDLAAQGLHKQARPLPFQTVKGKEMGTLQQLTQRNLKNAKHVISPDGVRHIWWRHGNPIREGAKQPPQIAVTGKDIALIPKIVKNYDKLTLSQKISKRGRKILIYTKKIAGHTYTYLEEVWKKKLYTKTMYIKK